jgi:hypothetical protein
MLARMPTYLLAKVMSRKQSPRGIYKDDEMAFWTSLFGKRKGTVDLEAPPQSLAHLRAQVFSEDYFVMKFLDRGKMAMRPLCAGLVEAIVEDLGAGERTVRWENLEHFGKSHDELFALARGQGAAAETGAQSQSVDGDVEVIITNGFYLSAYLLERFAKREQKQGVLFVPLSWHHWCVHIIGPMTMPQHPMLLGMVAGQIATMMTVTDAERLNQNVYWYKPGGVIEKLEFVGDMPTSPELLKALEHFKR